MKKIDLTPREFAIRAHGKQKYGNHPYSVHLDHVQKILNQSAYASEQTLSTAAWLHDVVEDTEVSISEIALNFGPEVADIVLRVTDEPGSSRKERKLKTYPKIKGHREATIVKLCDRIANVEASLGVSQKLHMYQSEYVEFRANLFVPELANDLWLQLDSLLSPQRDPDV